MTERDPVRVTVVTGFLGAGKTTLVNRWLDEWPRGDIAVIVNEHGSVGIDGALLAARVRTLVEIAGGCVCCSTRAELARALEDITSAPSPPKRILIETSGAASPAGVLHTVYGSASGGDHVLDGVVTVVDGTRVDGLRDNDLALEQVGYADIIVLSRTDLVGTDEIGRAREVVASHNGAALVVGGSRGDVGEGTLSSLLEQRRSDFVSRDTASAPPAHRVYESVSLVIDGDVDDDRFADFMEGELERFGGRIFRTKGILSVRGLRERMIVQGVADRVEVSFGEPWDDERRTSRFVIVGFGLDRAALERGFGACAADR